WLTPVSSKPIYSRNSPRPGFDRAALKPRWPLIFASEKRSGRMTTAIIGVGNIGSAVAGHLVAGDESVVLAARDQSDAETVAQKLGPGAAAASVEDAIAG